MLIDRIVGDTVVYDYSMLENRAALIANDDLTDWVLAVPDGRDGAAARALDRWQATNSTPWLVAALWTLLPTVLVSLIFFFVLRSIIRADRTERRVYAKIEAKERAKRGLPPVGPGAASTDA